MGWLVDWPLIENPVVTSHPINQNQGKLEAKVTKAVSEGNIKVGRGAPLECFAIVVNSQG